MMWNYGFGWFFPGIFWIVIWIFVLSFIFGRGHRWHNHVGKDKKAEDILDERFAKGEIDEDEYGKRLAVLRKHAK